MPEPTPCGPLRPLALLVLLWAGYFHPLILHPTETLHAPYSDFLAEHVPAKLFLVRAWHETGELPLWNPHHFCGSPFVHDIQVGMFYPPNAVLLLAPEGAVGAAMSWLVALHVLAAGAFALVYARAHGLNAAGSFVAAAGFMLSPKWMTHLLLAGHSITVGLAWLPLVLLFVERAIERRSAAFALAGGCALALLGLGTHPQWALYAGVFAVAWTAPGERANLKRWAGVWLAAVVLAAMLAAVQLLPTWEASRWSARTLGMDSVGALEMGPRSALRLLGPSLGYETPWTWEVQGVFGLYWVVAAAAAPALVGGRTRWRFGVLCGLVVFALGGAALVEWVPPFSAFRLPGRMLLVVPFPLAFLAGTATDALTRAGWPLAGRLAVSRAFRRVALLVGVPTVVGLWFADAPVWWAFVAYWAAAALALPAFVRALQNRHQRPAVRAALWVGVLAVDLVAPVAALPATRPQKDIYPTSPLLDALRSAPRPARVLDWDLTAEDAHASFLGVGMPLTMVYGLDTPRGYNPLDVRHYREFLAYVVDDPRPVRGYGLYAQQVMYNFEVGNPSLFELLRVTHRVAPADAPPLPGAWAVVGSDAAPPAVVPLQPRSPNPLPPHTLTASARPGPRAWVVPRAEPMPEEPLPALAGCDFARTVLISGPMPAHAPPGASPGAARVVEQRPNAVRVELDGAGGWLVLADVWFPGWTCRVDGTEMPVCRANHAFRAVPVPEGARVAEFRFEPLSYRVGWWISTVSLGAVVVALLGLHLRPVAVDRPKSSHA